jgi:hypothetical protein
MKATIQEAQSLWINTTNAILNKAKILGQRAFVFRYENAAEDPDGLCYNLSEFLGVDIINKSDYFKPTNMGKWQKDHPDMMDELSDEFKSMLRRLKYETI